ncbi:MAG: GNAT family N-acetyltransferase [Planctomycetes bacterium]|nr:GNAT family N-acetyltransferase [Planctomycetota bacterium]
MRNADARRVAQLHAESITEGFLSRLGRRFLAALYRGIAGDEASAVFVADEDARVLGFCACVRDVSAMYRRVLRARFWRLGFASLPRSLNPWVLKEISDTLRYPAKQAAQALPSAEILSIAVDSAVQGKGIGRALLDAALRWARQDGERQIKVLAGAKLDQANRFYQSGGFRKAAELEQHGEVLNVYVRDLEAEL